MAFRAAPLNARRQTAAAGIAFAAFAVLFGTLGHLVAELFGLGWRIDASVVLSPRHDYLVLLALLALAGLVAAVRMLPRAGRRARVDLLIDALPSNGRGVGFAAAAFLAQCGFSAITQLGEGYPLGAGDVAAGVIAGAVAAVLGAVIVTLCKRRVLEFALALVCAMLDATCDRGVAHGLTGRRAAVPAARRTPFAFRYRPPPIAA